jgi:hypothetical protein
MNRTVKEATAKTFHQNDLESLKTHVFTFVTAYNFAKHLNALKWRTPFQSTRRHRRLDPRPAPVVELVALHCCGIAGRGCGGLRLQSAQPNLAPQQPGDPASRPLSPPFHRADIA